MLNEEGKAEIRAEEIYRLEVRKEIEFRDGNRWIKFFNTPLGIWLLSTVIVGLISLSYKTWQDNLQSQKVNQERISIVLDEGNFRIRQMDSAINSALDLYEKTTASIVVVKENWPVL